MANPISARSARAIFSEYDFSEFERVKFEFKKKSARIHMRVSQGLLDRIKTLAKKRGMPYTRFIREILEACVSEDHIRSSKS